MESNKKFSYKSKLEKLEGVQDALETAHTLLNELKRHERLSADPNDKIFGGLLFRVQALQEHVESIRVEVEPMAFFEKKSA